MAELISRKQMNKIVSHLPGVKTAVYNRGVVIANRANALLNARPGRTGESKIVIEQAKTDTWVSLADKAALAIEYGHWVEGADPPRYVRGLYIITRAAGI